MIETSNDNDRLDQFSIKSLLMLMIAFALVAQGRMYLPKPCISVIRMCALLLGVGYLALHLYSWIATYLVSRFKRQNPTLELKQ